MSFSTIFLNSVYVMEVVQVSDKGISGHPCPNVVVWTKKFRQIPPCKFKNFVRNLDTEMSGENPTVVNYVHVRSVSKCV